MICINSTATRLSCDYLSELIVLLCARFLQPYEAIAFQLSKHRTAKNNLTVVIFSGIAAEMEQDLAVTYPIAWLPTAVCAIVDEVAECVQLRLTGLNLWFLALVLLSRLGLWAIDVTSFVVWTLARKTRFLNILTIQLPTSQIDHVNTTQISTISSAVYTALAVLENPRVIPKTKTVVFYLHAYLHSRPCVDRKMGKTMSGSIPVRNEKSG
ncbi:hypothetical protein B0H13DRAFT_1853196 [Mycena leptocephala]|nr:hypothetical protein B0H13DRAFT_1853196 [Mycena leptocephala]